MKVEDIERSKYSQNGEDGIIEFLLASIKEPTHDFVEIGCGNGHQCNTTALAIKGYSGVVFDGSLRNIEAYYILARKLRFANEVAAFSRYVTRRRAKEVSMLVPDNPDFLSIDIDGIDWYIIRILLNRGTLPKVLCVEYNAAFGQEPFVVDAIDKFYSLENVKFLYFGASVKAWELMLAEFGYKFVTVCNAGINAFFVHKDSVDWSKIKRLEAIKWKDCAEITKITGMAAPQRFKKIKLPVKTVSVGTEIKVK